MSAQADIEEREFPHLRKITLSGYDSAIIPPIRIQNAPMLRKASLRITDACKVQLPWTQLTKLRLDTWGPTAACLPVLSQCSDLLHLVYRTILVEDVPNTFSLPNLTLNTLDALDVNFVGSSIVPHFTLPRLRQLIFSGYITSATAPLRALFVRSSGTLSVSTSTLRPMPPFAMEQLRGLANDGLETRIQLDLPVVGIVGPRAIILLDTFQRSPVT
ncbi:hypothetical protein B0H19DRAFT_1252890 [Mycena capillaripes]|nr:hypothetical protein B0H19DRAFT_1252890 [Mycena capillaripes]